MRKIYALLAVLAVAGCDSATASEGRQGAALAPQGVQASITPAGVVAVVSVRKVVPGLYAARAAVPTGLVTLIVRQAPASFGFPDLTSGTELVRFHQTGMAEVQFSASAGSRYLVMAVPGESDPALLNYTLANFTEITP